ncbi:MAG: hypothetical protein CTY31_11175 [Hyphomicrobium sp.]|nr:MAG: hypothetical protein CTY39_04415 [Hyphomicrobium sp.]PPC98978.1 MAG: hypothetical protein CTY31_11175 [Hyphomicrobium sp.]
MAQMARMPTRLRQHSKQVLAYLRAANLCQFDIPEKKFIGWWVYFVCKSHDGQSHPKTID